MKLIIQIPCYNEEKYLKDTIKDLPKKLEGINDIEYLIIDDGSTDGTVDVAKKSGVHHIVRHSRNFGLSKAFSTGIKTCLKLGADIIVNTDADNQYCGKDIKKLIKPILVKKAGIVIGARPIDKVKTFSVIKKVLQKLGSWVVRILSGTNVQDAPSGFRAISKEAAYKINVFNKYTYTLETIIQAGRKDIPIISVPIEVNEVHRPSRLIKNIPSYVFTSIVTIIRMFITYKPLRFFASLSGLFFLAGLIIGIRYLYFFILGNGAGHIQSLILMLILLILSFLLFMMGLLGNLMSVNRVLIEDIQYIIRKMENKE